MWTELSWSNTEYFLLFRHLKIHQMKQSVKQIIVHVSDLWSIRTTEQQCPQSSFVFFYQIHPDLIIFT